MTPITIADIPSDVKVVIFDLDGTLYDKHGLARRLIFRQVGRLSFLSAERSARKRLAGTSFGSESAFYAALFDTMQKGRWFSRGMASWWYNRDYMPTMVRTLAAHYRLEAWVWQLMADCRKRGLSLAVYSDYGCVKEKLNAIQLDSEYFDWWVSAPQLGGLKPCKQSMEKLLSIIGVEATDCVLIGDRADTDGLSAAAVGCRFLCCK